MQSELRGGRYWQRVESPTVSTDDLRCPSCGECLCCIPTCPQCRECLHCTADLDPHGRGTVAAIANRVPLQAAKPATTVYCAISVATAFVITVMVAVFAQVSAFATDS
jgi:hypothetical protein